jgi:hypothetical protein
VVSRLDATLSRVIVPHVEIGDSVAEMELGETVTGDTRNDERTEST